MYRLSRNSKIIQSKDAETHCYIYSTTFNTMVSIRKHSTEAFLTFIHKIGALKNHLNVTMHKKPSNVIKISINNSDKRLIHCAKHTKNCN